MSHPPSKKRRKTGTTTAAAAAAAKDAVAASSPAPAAAATIKAKEESTRAERMSLRSYPPPSPALAVRTQSTAAVGTLLTLLDDVETSVASPALGPLLSRTSGRLLDLKRIQRSLCLEVETDLIGRVDAAREAVEARSLRLQNLVYERSYLAGQVRECRDLGCEELVTMARDELGIGLGDEGEGEGGGEGEGEGEEKTDNGGTAGAASSTPVSPVDRFLSAGNRGDGPTRPPTADHRDPTHHARNLTRLRSELTLRRAAESDLVEARAELADLGRGTTARRAFLDALPRKIGGVERSTVPLQDFFREYVMARGTGTGTGTGTGESAGRGDIPDKSLPTLLLLGTDRSARIEAALALPGPLYTLYVQLQGYLDAFGTDDAGGGGGGGGGPARYLKLDVVDDPLPGGREEVTGAAAASRFTGSDPPRGGADGTDAAGYWSAPAGRAVVLTVPVPVPAPDLGGGASPAGGVPPAVRVRFRYLPRLGLVTAVASDGGDGLDPSRVLPCLFPNDDGLVLPGCFAPFLVGDAGGGTSNSEARAAAAAAAVASGLVPEIEALLVRRGDRPYSWCQCVAGLQFPPAPLALEQASASTSGLAESEMVPSHHPAQRGRIEIERSSRAVVRNLLRRVRAQATLSALLRTLERRKPDKIPVHPSLASTEAEVERKHGKGALNPASRLVGWTETLPPTKAESAVPEDKGCRYFLAMVKHRNSTTLRATVRIDSAYPAVLPLWSLQTCTAKLDGQEGDGVGSSWGGRLGTAGSLLPRVDDAATAPPAPPLYDPTLGGIEDAVNATDLAGLVVDGVEDTYDWVLAHQLRTMIRCWDEAQGGAEGGSGPSTSGGGFGGVQRGGRDRRRVGFDLYSKGL